MTVQMGMFAGTFGGWREVRPGEFEIPLSDAAPLRYFPNWIRDPGVVFDGFVKTLDWEQHQFQPPGTTSPAQRIPMPRLECWYSLIAGRTYRYSGNTYRSNEITPPLFALLTRVNKETGNAFDAVFCNLYRDGRDSIGFHADDEVGALGPASGIVIASVSLGARRQFVIAHQDRSRNERVSLDLGEGDLLIMGLGTQANYVHGVPKQSGLTRPRINFTFRKLR